MTHILNRILQGFFSLLGVASLIFFMFCVLPGDPAEMMLDQNQNKKQLEVLKDKFGLNLPILDQYFYYLNDLSPISIHSTNKSEFSHYEKKKYGGIALSNFKNKVIVFKYPYLRTSYQRRGKPILDILYVLFSYFSFFRFPIFFLFSWSEILFSLVFSLAGPETVNSLSEDSRTFPDTFRSCPRHSRGFR